MDQSHYQHYAVSASEAKGVIASKMGPSTKSLEFSNFNMPCQWVPEEDRANVSGEMRTSAKLRTQQHCCKLTCTDGGFTLQRQCLQALLIGFQAQFGQVLLDLPGHLRILVKLFGIQEGAAAHPLLVAARLGDVEHCRIGTTLAEGPECTYSHTGNINTERSAEVQARTQKTHKKKKQTERIINIWLCGVN